MICNASLQTEFTRKNLNYLYCFYSEDLLCLGISTYFLFSVKTW